MEQALSQEAINNACETFGYLEIKPVSAGENALDVTTYLDKYGVEVVKVKPYGNSTLYCLQQCVFDSSHVNNDAAIGQNIRGQALLQVLP